MSIPDELLMDRDPLCAYCKHILEIGTQRSLEGWKCHAYPEGIPFGIVSGSILHDQKLPGQDGDFLFESKLFGSPERDQFVMTLDGEWQPASKEQQDGADQSQPGQDEEAGA